ncbi:hypothetical protein BGZ93_001890, partial [Podila epicladia]
QQQLYMQAQFMSMDLHHQPLGLNSPPVNSSSSWGNNFVRPSIGLSSPPSRTLSPPLGLHNNGSNSPSKHPQSFQQVPMTHPNGLGLTVGSGRKSVSHISMHPSETTTTSGSSALGNGMRSHSGTNGQVMENDRLANGYPYGQQQQHLHSHPLGAIGESTHREGV